MKKGPKKDCGINIRVTQKEREEIQKLAALSGKGSVSEFILSTVFNTSPSKPPNDEMADLLALLKKHFSDVKNFQLQQQVITYIIVQFVMWLNVQHHSRDEIMEFYNEQYDKACEEFKYKD